MIVTDEKFEQMRRASFAAKQEALAAPETCKAGDGQLQLGAENTMDNATPQDSDREQQDKSSSMLAVSSSRWLGLPIVRWNERPAGRDGRLGRGEHCRSCHAALYGTTARRTGLCVWCR